jgi:hypothetical protein
MYIEEGSVVVIVDVDQPSLSKYIGTSWVVKNVMNVYSPAAALIHHTYYGDIVLPLRCLEVTPPKDSPLAHDEMVRIIKPYAKEIYHNCRPELVGKTGKVRGYDTRNNYFFVKATNGDSGWFPIHCLVPLNFKGEKFYYPEQDVIVNGNKVKISKIRSTRFGNGQLLFINGSWVPSTDVSQQPHG